MAIYDVMWLIENADRCQTVSKGRWVPARPISGTFRWERLSAAWEVLRGRCDALRWPEPDTFPLRHQGKYEVQK